MKYLTSALLLAILLTGCASQHAVAPASSEQPANPNAITTPYQAPAPTLYLPDQASVSPAPTVPNDMTALASTAKQVVKL